MKSPISPTVRPLAIAVVYVSIGVLPLYLTGAQLVSLDSQLGFDAGRFGIATAVYFGVAALLAAPIGRVVQRSGATTGLRLGATLSFFASGVMATAGAWWVLPIGIALAGTANAFMQISTNVVLAVGALLRRQGISFGAKQGAIPLASAFAGALLPTVGLAVGWRWPFVMAMGIAGWAFVRAPTVPAAPDRPQLVESADRFRPSVALRFLAFGGACGGAAGNALSLFVVPSAVAVGVMEATAGALLAGASLLVLSVRLAAGWLADRRGSTGHREMVALLAVGAVACAGLVTATAVPAYLVALPVAMMGAWGWPGLAYFAVIRLHPEAPARASGVLLSSNLTGTLLGPMSVGFLASSGSYRSAWILCGALTASAATAMAASGRAHRRAIEYTRLPIEEGP